MIFCPVAHADPPPTRAERRRSALRSAVVLRDCSLRETITPPERRACRTLMRQAAFHWRWGADVCAWCGE